MKKYMLLLVVAPLWTRAQTAHDQDLQSLVEAEWAFINMAKERNTRDAFLTFLSDSAVTFGAAARIGKSHLEKQSADETWLYWEPVYSDISAAGDFGYNTGPWELRKDRKSEEAVAFGQFTTVWKKQNGQWKALIDIGVTHTRPERKEAWSTSSVPLKNIQAVSKSMMQKVIAEEQRFIKEYHSKKTNSYPHHLSHEARLYRHQHHPVQAKDVVTANVPHASAYKFLDGQIASSGDLAYVYGQAMIELDQDGKVKVVEGNYMRIWKKEDGKNWKIVLDVLTYL
jgi:ketosteroid isomerase-like protein